MIPPGILDTPPGESPGTPLPISYPVKVASVSFSGLRALQPANYAVGQPLVKMLGAVLLFTLRGAVYCYRSCLFVCNGRALCVCAFVGLLPR